MTRTFNGEGYSHFLINQRGRDMQRKEKSLLIRVSFLVIFLFPKALFCAQIPIFGKVYQSFKGMIENPYLLLTLGFILAGFFIYFLWKNMWIRAAMIVAIGAIIADFVGVSEWIVGTPKIENTSNTTDTSTSE